MCYCVLLQCVVGGCNASFASQGGLARHVPSHFSQQNSSKMSSQAKLKEESPSKAGLNKRKKLKNKRRCSLRTYLTDTQTKTVSNVSCCGFCLFLFGVDHKLKTFVKSSWSLMCCNRFFFQLSKWLCERGLGWPHMLTLTQTGAWAYGFGCISSEQCLASQGRIL